MDGSLAPEHAHYQCWECGKTYCTGEDCGFKLRS